MRELATPFFRPPVFTRPFGRPLDLDICSIPIHFYIRKSLLQQPRKRGGHIDTAIDASVVPGQQDPAIIIIDTIPDQRPDQPVVCCGEPRQGLVQCRSPRKGTLYPVRSDGSDLIVRMF